MAKTTRPAAPLEDKTEAQEIAEIKRLFRQKMLAALNGENVRASTLAVVGKYLDQVGALDHKPGKKPQEPTIKRDRSTIDKLPFEEGGVKQFDDDGKIVAIPSAPWKTSL